MINDDITFILDKSLYKKVYFDDISLINMSSSNNDSDSVSVSILPSTTKNFNQKVTMQKLNKSDSYDEYLCNPNYSFLNFNFFLTKLDFPKKLPLNQKSNLSFSNSYKQNKFESIVNPNKIYFQKFIIDQLKYNNFFNPNLTIKENLLSMIFNRNGSKILQKTIQNMSSVYCLRIYHLVSAIVINISKYFLYFKTLSKSNI